MDSQSNDPETATRALAALADQLRALGGLDGALVLAVDHVAGGRARIAEASVTLRAYHDASPPDLAWRVVRIVARGSPMLSWLESRWDSNSVLNWPVRVFQHECCIFVDFDPLHASVVASGVSLSRYFVAGTEVSLEMD